jgi:hypothetical protein
MTASHSSRRTILRSAGAATALIAAAGGGRLSAAAQEDAGRHPVMGTWWVTSVPPGGLTLISTYHADGTYTDGGPPSSPAPPDAPHKIEFFGSGQGVWEPIDDRRAAVTLGVYRSDEAGNTVGVFHSRGVIEIDETGNAYSASWSVEVLDADLNPLATVTAETAGRRMIVERIPESAATPTG